MSNRYHCPKHLKMIIYFKHHKLFFLSFSKRRMFTIYSKDNCSYCIKTRKLLDEKNINYTLIKPSLKMVNELKEETGHTTFPFIFKDKNFLGGYSQLLDYFDESF